MEAMKVSKNGKSIVLDSGLELTYCEFGEENDEVLLTGAFYFHTFTPVVEALAKRYHVYGIVMRFDGPITQVNKDGSTNWSRQWGEDIYNFAKAMGIDKFHYVGKCHGTNPGWYLIKEHPEVMETFCSLYMVPHLCERNSNEWARIPKEGGPMALISLSMRNQDRIPIKVAEIQSLAGAETNAEAGLYGESPQLIWDTLEECEESLRNITTPVMVLFGTDDILYHDYYDSNLKAMEIIPGCKTILLQGERHLMEIDCAERMANEAIFFIDESRQNY